ncbi:hypothetical protein HHL16_09315 [Pseudoflavitalea sp. G-6-1-2]|uniref:hypothetical protein n=1 Tax=Pseudoflavitalea sp. G-6-1-2 TaxID=2728841 RepID=UPI00146F3040|nr:hypothetical protein [Pseudoflavitalea sp. G-6-1-2]NML21071.1 hypothetical protein [Pseudoflavitalea sp. G-6-1-2]
MRSILPIVLLICIAACTEKQKAKPANAKIPMVLEGKHVDVTSLSKKRADLFENLYEELLSKSQELQILDANIKALGQLQSQAADSFAQYDSRNRAYYKFAEGANGTVSDSAIKRKIRTILQSSLKEYNASVASHRELDSLINRKNTTVHDMYVLLKVVKTLPSMEFYQKERLPGTGEKESLKARMDSLLQQLDTMTVIPKP